MPGLKFPECADGGSIGVATALNLIKRSLRVALKSAIDHGWVRRE
jgi:hypothetical protein